MRLEEEWTGLDGRSERCHAESSFFAQEPMHGNFDTLAQTAATKDEAVQKIRPISFSCSARQIQGCTESEG